MHPKKRFVLLFVVCIAACAWFAGSAASRTSAGSSLTIAATTPPDTLNPQQSALNQTWPYWQLSYECLMRTLPSGQLIPWLAKSYTVNSANTVYDFTLRPGVKFSNGEPLTAADVVYTFQQLKATGIPYANNRFPTLTSVTAPSAMVAEFTLSAPQPGFLLNMGDPFDVGCAILSQKAGPANLSNQMVGTGPFTLTSYSPNRQLVFKRNDSYWGKKAGVANLTIDILPDPAAQLVAISSGKVGLIFPDASIIKALQSERRKIKLGSVISATNLRVEFGAGKAPFDDVNVRRAVMLAVDPKAVVAGAYLGYGAPATYVPYAYAWAPKAAGYQYMGKPNVTKAKQLLATAGFPNGFTTNFIYTTISPSVQRFAQVLQSQLAAIGITLNLQPVDTPTYLSLLGAANYGLAFNQYPFFSDPSLYVTPRANRNGPVPGQISNAVAGLSQATSLTAYQAAIQNLAVQEDDAAFPNFSIASPTQFVAYQTSSVHNVRIDFTAGWLFLANVTVS